MDDLLAELLAAWVDWDAKAGWPHTAARMEDAAWAVAEAMDASPNRLRIYLASSRREGNSRAETIAALVR